MQQLQGRDEDVMQQCLKEGASSLLPHTISPHRTKKYLNQTTCKPRWSEQAFKEPGCLLTAIGMNRQRITNNGTGGGLNGGAHLSFLGGWN